jgi:hypothetical protein
MHIMIRSTKTPSNESGRKTISIVYKPLRIPLSIEVLREWRNGTKGSLNRPVLAPIIPSLATTNGIVMATFTSLLGVSDVVQRFMSDPSPDRVSINMTLVDAGLRRDDEAVCPAISGHRPLRSSPETAT